MEKIRAALINRGKGGIVDFGRSFNVMDKNKSQTLDLEEFTNLVNVYRIELSDREIEDVFRSIDTDGSNKISYKEFLKSLRPPMSETRLDLVDKAFQIMDTSGDGTLTVDDLKNRYSARCHPKFVSGEWTEEQCLREFLDSFDNENKKDGKVTKDEWLDYYSGVSAFIDSDQYFVEMMNKVWQL